MSVKASVSISEQNDAYARKLVEDGHFANLSEIVQRGLELVREETEMKEAELAALRALLEERMRGPFLTADESSRQIRDMVAEVKASYGL